MEKRRPTYDLARIKLEIGTEATIRISGVARLEAVRLGFDRRGIAAVIQSIDRRMFYKSMTTYRDHHVWQDVYHVPHGDLTLYVKFQQSVLTELFVVSFKEK